MADSAIDYVAEITSLSLAPNRLQVKYTPADSADSSRGPIFRNISIAFTQYNDSDIQVIIKNNAPTVVSQWNSAVDNSAANPSFNLADFVGDTYNFRYKPRFYDSYPTFNQLYYKAVPYDSEGADEIRTKYSFVQLDSAEKATAYSLLTVSKSAIELKMLAEDRLVRKIIREDGGQAMISRIEIERFPGQIWNWVHSARPGVIIGRKGANIKAMRLRLQEVTGKRMKIEVEEISRPDLDSYLVAENIAEQLGRRISHKRAMKRAVSRAMSAGGRR